MGPSDADYEDYGDRLEAPFVRNGDQPDPGLISACSLRRVVAGALIFSVGWVLLSRGQSEEVPSSHLNFEMASAGNRPVLLLHGLSETSRNMASLASWIGEARPGVKVMPLAVYEGPESFLALPVQVDGVVSAIREIVKKDPDSFNGGYDLVCFSQGALICRVVCQVMDDHRVHTLISLAGPQLGIYGSAWLSLFGSAPEISIAALMGAQSFHSLAYNQVSQSANSIFNLWNDPLHQDEFLAGNAFLPMVNGLSGPVPAGMLANFKRVQRAVFLAGHMDETSDGVLEPWNSGVFGYFAKGSDSQIQAMSEQDFFEKDTFGLKTLNDTGRLHLEAVSGVRHGDWTHSRDVFKAHVLQHLS
mmetsp:Transcript_59873/g.129799  ORF Transcript_59873/g.129799 Transcript_59873/m.129799 type:complete len:359 (+) Transcript_59873:81-1157(+)